MKVKVKPWRGAPETVAKPGIGEAWAHTFDPADVYVRTDESKSPGIIHSVNLRSGQTIKTFTDFGDIVPLRLEKVLKDGTAVFAAAGKTGKGKGK